MFYSFSEFQSFHGSKNVITLKIIFQSHHKASQYGKDKPLINFDYHSECRGGNLKNLSKLRDRIKKQLDSFEFFYVENDESKK